MSTAQRERRMQRAFPTRIEERGDGDSFIEGYAAVFFNPADPENTQYDLGFGITERIMPGAFNRALAERQDVRGLGNHDDNWLLGRTSSGTMQLTVDNVGLKYRINGNPEDPDHKRASEKLKRGDLSGSSFSFIPMVETWRDEGDLTYRELTDVDLFDVGPVTFPAYSGTSAALRSITESEADDVKSKRDEWRSKQKPEKPKADAVAMRMRQIQIDSDSLSIRQK
jgi:HK97 family phage prohead protease